jgi:predicted DNA-binding transcriptional regulator AlpA
LRIVRPKEAKARLGIGWTKYFEDRKKGLIPPVVRLGPRCVGHVEEELDGYIEKLKAERDKHSA